MPAAREEEPVVRADPDAFDLRLRVGDLLAEPRLLALQLGEEDRPTDGPLTGHTYVITGTLERYTRDEAAAALEAKGAKITNSVSSKTTGLVVGEEPGASKLTKARKAEVPLLTEVGRTNRPVL